MEILRQGPIDPQAGSPLFNRIPPEIRNYIFELALTSFDDKTKPYKRSAYYYRPDFRYAQKIDTTLLCTCRRIFSETRSLSATINEYASWFNRPPPEVSKNALRNELSFNRTSSHPDRRQVARTIHLFTQQYWLEGQVRWNWGFKNFTRRWNLDNATRLKITLRHSDWWYWENEHPIALEPKRAGRPSAFNYQAGASDPFDALSWGSELRNIKGLKEFQMELETVEKKKLELDVIVARAPGWQFPLGDQHVLILDESKTRRTGWVGHILTDREIRDYDVEDNGTSLGRILDQEVEDVNPEHAEPGAVTTDHHQENGGQSLSTDSAASHPESSTSKGPTKPTTAKERLVADGVKFWDEDMEPDLPEDKTLTYYVVHLTWYAHPRERN